MPWILKFQRYQYLLLLICILGVTRFACRSHYLYDIDSVNFALGMQRFDPSVHQPHPPGYFLYIVLGRLLDSLFFHDANTTLVAISIAATGAALVFIYWLTESWFGRVAAWFGGLLFVFSPLAWFHGTVALTYGVEVFFASMAGYLCWQAYAGRESFLLPAAVSIALAAGFRPSFLLFMSPLFLFTAWRAGWRSRGLAAGAFLLTLLAWFLPLLWASGGLVAYGNAFYSLWHAVPGKSTVLNSSLLNSLARFCFIIGIYVLCFGCAAFLPLLGLSGGIRVTRSIRIFCWVWIGPGLLFFTFVFLKFVNSGYLLVLSPPLFALLGMLIARWWQQGHSLLNKMATLVVCLAANVLIYFFAPVYCSYAAVRHFEGELETVTRSIPKVASPTDTLIVGFDSHFLGYRHAGYYLPAYLTLQYPEVRLTAGVRVFAMRNRDTALLDTLPITQFKRFVLLPLPGGDQEYLEYMVKIKALFPKGELQTTWVEGKEYIIGPISQLPVLFPVARSPRARHAAR